MATKEQVVDLSLIMISGGWDNPASLMSEVIEDYPASFKELFEDDAKACIKYGNRVLNKADSASVETPTHSEGKCLDMWDSEEDITDNSLIQHGAKNINVAPAGSYSYDSWEDFELPTNDIKDIQLDENIKER